jgi:hypothetical protein
VSRTEQTKEFVPSGTDLAKPCVPRGLARVKKRENKMGFAQGEEKMATLEDVVKMWDNKPQCHDPIISLKGCKEYGKLVITSNTDDRIAVFMGKYAKISLSNNISAHDAHAICYTFLEEDNRFTVFFEKLPEYNNVDANVLYDFCKDQFGSKKIKGLPFSLFPKKKPDPMKGVVKLILNIPTNESVNFIVGCMEELISLTQSPLSTICK